MGQEYSLLTKNCQNVGASAASPRNSEQKQVVDGAWVKFRMQLYAHL